MSKLRLITKSAPSKTGGFSSNSGTVWPGTSSWRWVMISIVVGAMRTATRRSWHWLTSSIASSGGKSGSAITTSCTRCSSSSRGSSASVPRLRSPLSGFGVSEM